MSKARDITDGVAYVGLTATIQFLKTRSVAAERRQRDMAHRDPLTGLANRRAFDAALAESRPPAPARCR